MADDPIEKLAVGVAADHQAEKRKGRAKAADTVAAGAIEGAGAALDAGGDARDVAAATIGGAAAATAEVTGDGSGEPLPPIEGEGAGELRQAVASLGEAVDEQDDREDVALERAIDRLIRKAQDAEFDRGTLAGDIRDALLDVVKANQKPWDQWREDQQRQVAGALETVAKVIIRGVVLIVAEDDADGPTIHAKLESYAEKGGLKISLTATGDRDTVIALHDAVGQNVIVKRADSTRYNGQRRDPAIDPDQPDLRFEGDGDDENPFDGAPAANVDPDRQGADADLADGFDQDRDQ